MKPLSELNVVMGIVMACLTPFYLVLWLLTVVPVLVWIMASIVLSTVTGRDWLALTRALPKKPGRGGGGT